MAAVECSGMMSPFIVLLLCAVGVKGELQRYGTVFQQHCPNAVRNTRTCVYERFRLNSQELYTMLRDVHLFTMPAAPDLTTDCNLVKLDSKNQSSAYQCARDVMLKCLPSEWHSLVYPVQNILDYRSYRCEKKDILNGCRWSATDAQKQTCNVANRSTVVVFVDSGKPDAALEAFCSMWSTNVHCYFGKCNQDAQSTIQEMYRKLRLSACGSATDLITSWVLLFSLATMIIIL